MKTNSRLPKGKHNTGDKFEEFGINIYTLLYVKQINNRNRVYRRGNSTQNSVITYMGKEHGKEWVYVCTTDNCIPETNTAL